MTTSEGVGTVARVWRFPVKSMGGEQLQEAELTERGVLGDRAYALIDRDTGKVVSAKSVKLFPELFRCQAVFVESPRPGGDVPPVQISLPDGSSVRSDSGEVDREEESVSEGVPPAEGGARAFGSNAGGAIERIRALGAGDSDSG